MPSAAARRLYEDQIPSFMSVFDLDADAIGDRDTVTIVDPKMMEVDQAAHKIQNDSHQLLGPNPVQVGRFITNNHSLMYRFLIIVRSFSVIIARLSYQLGSSKLLSGNFVWRAVIHGEPQCLRGK
ncbi:putative tyrosine-protein phosphatase pmp1 protein [Phaeoacremonium minimum UCRPA7]|uniref:Putative tyrosine-protein phosphatase pmp1 protein n=1 Tax=Phaeoacremonium minimum (strain UCR-PA7) TaxID=1286976 RepID=R8BXL3_PHAM7|nr:putative tyrosine-protein phosphatase pmp1 protein [Phaeoacremonium minimum UCRPA7]EOO04082.1 putative tyrosine-protein phosphatase pmp1 protein [Phaeoacremonium minimum UCRPA7]